MKFANKHKHGFQQKYPSETGIRYSVLMSRDWMSNCCRMWDYEVFKRKPLCPIWTPMMDNIPF